MPIPHLHKALFVVGNYSDHPFVPMVCDNYFCDHSRNLTTYENSTTQISFCSFCLFLFLFSLYSQSKSETEQWILEKIRNNVQEFSEHGSKDILEPNPTWSSRSFDYQFRFDNENLIIEFTLRKVSPRYNGSTYDYEAKNNKVKVLIPIHDIKEILKSGVRYVTLPTKSAICDETKISTTSASIRYFKNDFEEFKRASITINLLNENDENLVQRINKAFLHLKHYYPKPQKTQKKVY